MSQNIIPSGQSHLLTEFRSHHTTRAGLQWLTSCPEAQVSASPSNSVPFVTSLTLTLFFAVNGSCDLNLLDWTNFFRSVHFVGLFSLTRTKVSTVRLPPANPTIKTRLNIDCKWFLCETKLAQPTGTRRGAGLRAPLQQAIKVDCLFTWTNQWPSTCMTKMDFGYFLFCVCAVRYIGCHLIVSQVPNWSCATSKLGADPFKSVATDPIMMTALAAMIMIIKTAQVIEQAVGDFWQRAGESLATACSPVPMCN